MEIHKLFFYMRKAKGLTQKQLAEVINVSQSAVARLERGEVTAISRQSLKDLAPQLHINPAFLDGENENPFSLNQNEFIIFKLGSGFKGPDISPINWFLENCNIRDVYALSPPLGVPGRLIRGAIADELTYAVLMRDIFDNIFLFRYTLAFVFLFYSQKESYERLHSTATNYNYEFRNIDRRLYDAIYNATVERAALDDLFLENIYPLTEAEEQLIRFVRRKELIPQKVIENIDKMNS